VDGTGSAPKGLSVPLEIGYRADNLPNELNGETGGESTSHILLGHCHELIDGNVFRSAVKDNRDSASGTAHP
jgi:hypothetical protein